MHELSVAHAVVGTAESALPAATRVLEVHVRVGALSGIVPEALEFSYDVAVDGTRLAGSALVIERVPVVVHCPACDLDGALGSAYDFRCPRCGQPTGDVRSGRELEITRLVLVDDTTDGDDAEDEDLGIAPEATAGGDVPALVGWRAP